MEFIFRCELRVVSDANLFFIETILNHLGLRDDYSEINTNPGFVDEEGKLSNLPMPTVAVTALQTCARYIILLFPFILDCCKSKQDNINFFFREYVTSGKYYFNLMIQD